MEDNMTTPYFAIETEKLEDNLSILSGLADRCNITILHTIKCFSEYGGLEIIDRFLDGYSISNFAEYQSINSEKPKYIHSYSPIYAGDVVKLAKSSDTMSFNSVSQWSRHAAEVSNSCSIGIRVNPNIEIEQPEYCDASNNNSRFGVGEDELKILFSNDSEILDGLHFHIFCYQGVESFQKLISHLESHFGYILPHLKWLNLGGGIALTDANFDIELFEQIVIKFRQKYPNLRIYLEPGSAVVDGCGYLACRVMDIFKRGNKMIAIVDTSIEAHLLDVAITKVPPSIMEDNGESGHLYQIAGTSCIAGDILGEYSFDKELKVGDVLRVANVIGYNISKQNNFNGIDKARLILV